MLQALEAIVLRHWERLAPGRGRPPAALSFAPQRAAKGLGGPRPVLVCRAGSEPPVAFVKVAREGFRIASLHNEHEMLVALRNRSDATLRASLPEPVCLEEVEGAAVLVLAACPGRRMNEEFPRLPWFGAAWRAAARHFRAACQWLIHFSRVLGIRREFTEADLERHVARRLETVYHGPRPAAAEAFLARLRSLVGGTMLFVPTHNDLNPNNLILREGGGLCVVDWEAGEAEGLPFVDLFHFSTLYFSFHRGLRPRRRRERFRRAYWGRAWYGGLVAGAAAAYAGALGLDPGLGETLFPLHVLRWLEVAGLTGASDERRRDMVADFERSVAWTLPSPPIGGVPC